MGDTIKRNRKVEDLEVIVDELMLRLRALEELCIRKKVLTRAELRHMAQEIDSVDGAVDGRVKRFVPPRRGE
jgi:hypothetical protein